MLTHSFSVEVAKVVGDRAATFLQYFSFWHIQNVAHKRNFHDGRYWTYNTVEAYAEQFPYLTAKEIRTVLERLKDSGYILTGNYNAKPMDRTKWYALTDQGLLLLGISDGHAIPEEHAADHLPNGANGNDQEGNCNLPYGQMHLPDQSNAFAQTGRAIPVNNTVNKPVVSLSQKNAGETNFQGSQTPPADRPSTTPRSAAPPSSPVPGSPHDQIDEIEAELIEFTERLQKDRRIVEGLSRLHQLRGQEALDWIERYVTTQWSADNLKNREPNDLMKHCLSWIKSQLEKKQDREQRPRPTQSNNRPGPAATGFAGPSSKRTGFIPAGGLSRRGPGAGNDAPAGQSDSIRVDVE